MKLGKKYQWIECRAIYPFTCDLCDQRFDSDSRIFIKDEQGICKNCYNSAFDEKGRPKKEEKNSNLSFKFDILAPQFQ